MDNNLIEIVKETPKILTTIYGDLAQPSIRKIGIALETVFEFSTSFLLPLKLQNEKFKLNFEKRLNEYKKKLDGISDEKIIEVNPQIGTPIIERLSYTTNDEIAKMFTNLLAKASSIDTVNLAHPSFIQLIERLSVDEAKLIQYLSLDDKLFIPYIAFKANIKAGGFIDISEKLTSLPFKTNIDFPQNMKTYLDNLSSIGIIYDKVGYYKTNEDYYKELIHQYKGLHELLIKQHQFDVFESVDYNKGYFQITDFGKSFISACVT
ncbi:DUF4393 domain-containing protein [Petrimonas sp.]|uniref:DUF4393 domain-containing protein n=1 Tax=Petrimonas sp. TaxID=2023866 RepID=UPI003F51562F